MTNDKNRASDKIASERPVAAKKTYSAPRIATHPADRLREALSVNAATNLNVNP